LERLEGYRLRVLSHHDDYPTVPDLVDPDMRDSYLVQTALKHYAHTINIQVPHACMAYLSGLHALSKKERRQQELPLITKTVGQALKTKSKPSKDFDIQWRESGRPVVTAKERLDLEISLSHDDRMCLVIAGKGPQGCDITKVTSRSREEWVDLIGKRHSTLLDSLIDLGDSLDRAGTRIWSSIEAARKVMQKNPDFLEIIRQSDNGILFNTGRQTEKLFILSFPLRFTRGRERILSLAIEPDHIPELLDLSQGNKEYEDLFRTSEFDILEYGPQGQVGFIHRIPVTFKHNAQLSRTVYFSNYFFWIGKIREASVWPVLGRMGKQFASGKWGIVTNKTKLKILGEVTVQDQIEIHLWASGNGGPANSTMELSYDFRKIIEDGNFERLAWCEQTTTWVEILDHGSVKPVPYPNYYWNLMKEMLPKYDAPNAPIPLPEPLANIKNLEGNEVHYQAPSTPVIRPLLHEQLIETSLEDSNVVGNVYFANYYVWQGRVRDQYFYNLIPDYFRGIGEKGELLCLECRVDHLREAMPFDRIMVTLALKKWRAYSAVFHIEYFRLDPDGKRVKLAYGEHEAIWVTRNKQGEPIPSPFPKPVEDAFRRAISKDLG